MKRDLKMLIVRFMENERQRAFGENELYKREILDEFFDYIDEVKYFEWSIKDITVEDRRGYMRDLESNGKKAVYIDGRISVIMGFLEFTVTSGVLGVNPWRDMI